jgi:hypothetical protein
MDRWREICRSQKAHVTESQITMARREVDAGSPVTEVAHCLGVRVNALPLDEALRRSKCQRCVTCASSAKRRPSSTAVVADLTLDRKILRGLFSIKLQAG